MVRTIRNAGGEKAYLKYFSLILIGIFSVSLFNDLYYTFAILIFFFQAFSFFSKLGTYIPMRNLIGMMFCLNYLFSPVLMFSWLNPYGLEQYTMKGEPEAYFSYAIPAMLLFIAGLNLFSKNGEEKIDVNLIKEFVQRNPNLPRYLVYAGVVGFLLVPFARSEISLIFATISYFRFVGFFLSLFSGKRFNIGFFLLSFGVVVIEALTSSMFSDLLYLSIFLGIFLSLRYRPSFRMILFGVGVGILVVVFIQSIKFNLRSKITGSVSDLEMLNSVIEESALANEQKEFENKVVDVVLRIDQGWVASGTMEHYRRDGFQLQNGRHALTILQSSILPRLLAPNKYKVGDRELFNTYSGHHILSGTSIALGILADGFIDFGENGIFSVLAFGLIINLFIKLYHRWSRKFVIAKIFIAIGFLYAIKADTDTHSALGALFKITLLIWIVLKIIQLKTQVKVRKRQALSKSPSYA